jgi:hypothetical protein
MALRVRREIQGRKGRPAQKVPLVPKGPQVLPGQKDHRAPQVGRLDLKALLEPLALRVRRDIQGRKGRPALMALKVHPALTAIQALASLSVASLGKF